MNSMKSVIRLVVACGAIIAAFALEAASYNKVEYSNSTTIVPGKWFSKFSSVLNYANENNVPMVVFWGNQGCGHCKHTEEKLGTSADFKAWMAESGIVFAYVINDHNLSGTAAQVAKLYAKSGTEYPFVGVYWKSNTKGERVGGKMGSTAKTYPAHFCGRDMSAAAIKRKILSYIPDWTPEKGGEFDFTESAANRYEVEAGSKSVAVLLTRRDSAKSAAYVDTAEVILPNGSITSNTVSWAAGESAKTVVLPLPDLSGLKDGQTITVRMNGNAKNTLRVHFVAKANSAANPLWLGERTALPPANQKASAAVPALAFGEWTMDLDVAKASVKNAEGNAYTLVAVEGSLWCHDCANTERNFLSIAEGGKNLVSEWAKANKVALVAVDVPNYSAADLNGAASPCLLTTNAVEKSLANANDVRLGGATEAEAATVARSGLGYLTRKGITAAAAAAQLAKFKTLVQSNTADGGFHRPEDANAYRTGVPIFVLLRKDGTVAARMTQFASQSPLKYKTDGTTVIATAERTRNILKRFDEMIEIANAAAGDVDEKEIENNAPSASSATITNGGAAANGRICNADPRDTFKIAGMRGAAKEKITVVGPAGKAIDVQLLVGSDVVGTASGSGTVTLTANATAVGDCSVLVKTKMEGWIPVAAFEATSAASTFAEFTVKAELEELLPQEAAATALGDSFKVKVVKGELYRLVGLADVPKGLVAVEIGDDIYESSVSDAVPVGANGSLTYQLWNPGVVGFDGDGEGVIVDGSGGERVVTFGRYGGSSGDVTVKVFVDDEATTFGYDGFTIDGKASKGFERTVTYKEGTATASDLLHVKINPFTSSAKDGVIVLRLGVVAGGALCLEDTYTIMAVKNYNPLPGTIAVKGAEPFFAKSATVYARQSSGVGVTLSRTGGKNCQVRAKFTAKVGKKAYSAAYLDEAGKPITSQSWDYTDNADKVMMVTNLPAVGKTLTLTLAAVRAAAKGESTPKINKKAMTVKIVSVADDATEFASEQYAFTTVRYAAFSQTCALKVAGKGISLKAKKLSGSLPNGISAKISDGQLVFSGTPSKAGRWSAVYQLLDNRGTKKKAKNVAGLPVKVTFTVVDPAAPGGTAGIVSPVTNTAVKATRTLSDLLVCGSVDDFSRLTGKLTVTIPRTGKLSAKYACDGGTIAFSASRWDAKDLSVKGADGTLVATLKPTKGANVGKYSLKVSAFADGHVKAMLTDSDYPRLALEAISDGKAWSRSNAATDWKGRYTATILPAGTKVKTSSYSTDVLPGTLDDGGTGLAPRGAGYLALTMTESKDVYAGRIRWAGKLPDGTKISGSSVLTAGAVFDDDEVALDYGYLPIFARVTTKLTSKVTTLDRIALVARIARRSLNCPRTIMPAEEFARGEWVHTVTKPAASSGAFSYKMDVFVFGNLYDPKANLKECCELDNVFPKTLGALTLGTMGAGVAPIAIEGDAVAIEVKEGKTRAKDTIKITSPMSENPLGLTLTFNRSTGVATGTFKLPYLTASGVRKTAKANWQGVILLGWCSGCSDCMDPPETLVLEDIFLPFLTGGYTVSWNVTEAASLKACQTVLGAMVESEQDESK